MKQLNRLIKKFILTLLAALTVLVIVDITLYSVYVSLIVNHALRPSITETMSKVSDSLTCTDKQYVLTDEAKQLLSDNHSWAMLLDNSSGTVLWNYDLPRSLQKDYTITEIAKFSRGYLDDYPVFVWEHPDGLLVVGYPKDSYTKQLSNYRPIALYRSMPFYATAMLLCNIFILFLIYYFIQSRTIRSVNPLVNAISDLAEGKTVSVKEQEPFPALAKEINQVSEQLRKRDTIRSNWITGVSHDIRTPLSVIMGEAELMLHNPDIPGETQKRASRIMLHSLRLRNLINDLNLASKLDYQMQPLKIDKIYIAPMLRKLAVDFLNRDYDGKYKITCNTEGLSADQWIEGDISLLERALENLISNSIVHNPEGCQIQISGRKSGEYILLTVSDNGCGITEEQLEQLRTRPHYMMSDDGSREPRHGLGLLIVSQIVHAHHGEVKFCRNQEGGFEAEITLPIVCLPLPN